MEREKYIEDYKARDFESNVQYKDFLLKSTDQDNICDGFHLYGTGDPLDYGLIAAYTAQYNTPKTARVIFDMLTKNSAKIFAPDENYGIEVGNVADLNIIDASNVQEALRLRASRPYIIKKGKVIASFERKQNLL